MKASSNGFQTSYSNERPSSSQGNSDKDNDLSSDPASSSFFTNDYKKSVLFGAYNSLSVTKSNF